MNSWNPQNEDFENRSFNPNVGGHQGTASFSLYVRNIPTDLSERGIKNLFDTYGKVCLVKLLPQKYPQGGMSGFVHFSTLREAENAIRSLNNFNIGKYCIKVQHAKAKQEKQNVNNSDYLSLLKKLEIGPLIEADLNNLIQKVNDGCFRNPLLKKAEDQQQDDGVAVSDDHKSLKVVSESPITIAPKNECTGGDFSLSQLNNRDSNAFENNKLCEQSSQEHVVVASEMLTLALRYKCGDEVDLIIVDVDPNEGTFVCQLRKEEEQQKLRTLHEELNQHYKHEKKQLANNLDVGKLCATVYSEDGEWYRGRVEELFDDTKTAVKFIDYGNVETIQVGKVYELKQKFYQIAAFSITCKLWCVETWSEEVTQLILDFLKQSNLRIIASVHKVINDVLFVDIQANGVSLVKHLQQNNLVSCDMKSFTSNTQQSTLNMSHNQMSNEADSSNLVAPNQLCAVTNEMPNLVQESLPKGDFKIFISHVNSPNSFYFQVWQDHSELKKPLQLLSEECLPQELQTPSTIGMFCAAKFQKENQWCRGKVLHCVGTLAVKVLSVDVGNIELISVSSLRQLPLQYWHHPLQAFKATLGDGQDQEGMWSEEALEYFQKTEGCTFNATVNSTAETNGKLHVTLTTESKEDVRDLLLSVELNVLASATLCCGTPVAKPPINVDLEIFITEVEQSGSFYCQLVDDNIALFAGLTKSLKQQCESNSSNGALTLNTETMYAAKSLNGQWYRAMIEQATEDGQFLVRYTDFGNTAVIGKSQIHTLPAKFNSLQAHAIKCQLHDAKPVVSNRWGKRFVEICREMIKKPVPAKFIANRGDYYSVKVPKLLNKLIAENIAKYC